MRNLRKKGQLKMSNRKSKGMGLCRVDYPLKQSAKRSSSVGAHAVKKHKTRDGKNTLTVGAQHAPEKSLII